VHESAACVKRYRNYQPHAVMHKSAVCVERYHKYRTACSARKGWKTWQTHGSEKSGSRRSSFFGILLHFTHTADSSFWTLPPTSTAVAQPRRLSTLSICQHTSAYVSICQHTSAYVSIRQKDRLEKVVTFTNSFILTFTRVHLEFCKCAQVRALLLPSASL